MSFKLNIYNGSEWTNILQDLYIQLDNTNWTSENLSTFLDELKDALDDKESRNVVKTFLDYTASSFDVILVDTSTDRVTITLPDNPEQGDRIQIIDVSGNAGLNEITVDRNGQKVNTEDNDVIIDVDFASIILIYDNATNGWHIDMLGSYFGADISEINDPYLTLNAKAITGQPTENGGIIISRGEENPVKIQWNENQGYWELTNDGISFGEILTTHNIGDAITHANLSGLDADDHTQYVHIENDREITATHTFNASTSGAPFVIGANSEKKMVEGLNSQYVNGILITSQSAEPANLNSGDIWIQEVV